MRRIVIGTGAGLVFWLGAALSAEAQISIDGTGPTAVYDTDTSSTYTAVVTCNSNFYLYLKVFLNGVQKHQSTTYVANSGPTYDFSKVVNMSGWGQKAGDILVYRGKAKLAVGTAYDEEDWTVTVTHKTTHLVPRRSGFRFLDRDREEWA